MKSFFSLILLVLSVSSTFSQNSKCRNIYIWEFADDNNQKNNYTKDLTNAVEEALVNLEECQVLQRRKIGSLQAQVENESSIQSVRDIKSNIVQNLSTQGAELVVFGVLNTLSKKEFELQLRIENLKTTKILRMKSIDLLITDLVDNSKKRKLVNQVVHELIGKKYTVDAEETDEKPEDTPKESNLIYEHENFVFELVSCKRFLLNIECKVKITHKQKDTELWVYHDVNQSRIILTSGNEYPMTDFRLADKVGSNGGYIGKTLVADVPITGVFTFRNVNEKVSVIPKLTIHCYSFTAEFRNITLKK